MRCTRCRSDDVLPIRYGLWSPETFEEVETADFVPGGCCIGPGSPNLYCQSCEHRWRDPSFIDDDPDRRDDAFDLVRLQETNPRWLDRFCDAAELD